MTNLGPISRNLQESIDALHRSVSDLSRAYIQHGDGSESATVRHSVDHLNSLFRLQGRKFQNLIETGQFDRLEYIEKSLEKIAENFRGYRNASRDLDFADVNGIYTLIQLARSNAHQAQAQLKLASTIIDPQDPSFKDAPALPESKPAPVQVHITDGILGLTNTQDRSGSIDYASANRIRETLQEALQDLLDDANTSNRDPGYVKACSRLNAILSKPVESISIESLGFQHQLVAKMTRRMADELGDATVIAIDHVLEGVEVLLNQFVEWRRYLDEQAKLKRDAHDTDGLVEQGQALIVELEKPGVPVQPELVDRLRAMVEPAMHGTIGADTVAIPLLLSLSNVFSALSQYAIDVYQSVAATGGIVTATTVTLSASAIMLKFSLDLLEKFAPTLSKYEPLAFTIKALRYLTGLYSQIKDLISGFLPR